MLSQDQLARTRRGAAGPAPRARRGHHCPRLGAMRVASCAETAPFAEDDAHDDISSRLLAFGAPSGAISQVVERAIFARGRELEKPAEDEEPSRSLNVWRGMTGQVLVAVDCKPKTTALQVKHEIYLKTGIPIEQQQLFGFGSSILIEDDALVDSVPELEGCGGLQIIVDSPDECSVTARAGLSASWIDCEEEAQLYEKEVSSNGTELLDSTCNSGSQGFGKEPHRRHNGSGGGNEKHFPRAGGIAVRAGQAERNGGDRSSHTRGLGQGGVQDVVAVGPKEASAGTAAVKHGDTRRGGRKLCTGPKGGSGGSCGSHGHWEAYVGPGGSKMQCHFTLHRKLQDVEFDVLSRTKHRTKNIWLATGVSLRLHGPGSGQQEHEQELMLSLSAKRSDCDQAMFCEAVNLAKDLIRNLNEQYRRFCVKTRREVPESLAIRWEQGYRKGSQKVRLGAE
mmetsp:Transcript_19665/g.52952  ORF Transcript_19665/g.52952 Transcript_19665/m.52952 type:complete len:451 (-) Transcript_19665:179-1531(-)